MSGNEAALDAGGGGSSGDSDTGGSTGDTGGTTTTSAAAGVERALRAEPSPAGPTSVPDQSQTGISGVAAQDRTPPREESVSATQRAREQTRPGYDGPVGAGPQARVPVDERAVTPPEPDSTSGGPLDTVQTGVEAGVDAAVPVPANPVDVAQDFANDPVDATTNTLTSPGVTAGTLAVTTVNPSTPPLSPGLVGRGALLAGSALGAGAAATTDRAQTLFGSEGGQAVARPEGTIAPEAEPTGSVPSLSAGEVGTPESTDLGQSELTPGQIEQALPNEIPAPTEPGTGTAEIPAPAEPGTGTAEIPTPTDPAVGSAEIGAPGTALATGATVGEGTVPAEDPFAPTIDDPTGPTIEQPNEPTIDESAEEPSIRPEEREAFRFPADGASESTDSTDVARSRDPARQAIERLEIAQSPSVPDPGRPGQDIGDLVSISSGGADAATDPSVDPEVETQPLDQGIADPAATSAPDPLPPPGLDSQPETLPAVTTGETVDVPVETTTGEPFENVYETGLGEPNEPVTPPGYDDPVVPGLGTPTTTTNTPNTPTTPGLPPFSGGGGGGGPQPPAFATAGAVFPTAIAGVGEVLGTEDSDDDDELFGLFGGV